MRELICTGTVSSAIQNYLEKEGYQILSPLLKRFQGICDLVGETGEVERELVLFQFSKSKRRLQMSPERGCQLAAALEEGLKHYSGRASSVRIDRIYIEDSPLRIEHIKDIW